VPQGQGIRDEVIAAFHDREIAGHFGVRKTLKAVQRGFYWPKMDQDVQRYVSSCDSCQRNKPLVGRPQGVHTPLPIASKPWESVSMDFVTALPCSKKGHDAVLVVVDRFTKMVKFIPTMKTVTAEGAARLFFDNVFRMMGMPKEIRPFQTVTRVSRVSSSERFVNSWGQNRVSLQPFTLRVMVRRRELTGCWKMH
jgi:hypothetical protein